MVRQQACAIFIAAAFAISFVHASGQTPSVVSTSAVSGVVMNGTTGRPLSGAIVAIVQRGNAAQTRTYRQVTDARGRFVFRDLASGPGYSITVTRTGFLDGAYGQTVMLGSSTTVALTDGQWFPDANITMWKPGAISGRVVDEHSEPMVGVYVRAMAQLRIAGELTIVGGPIAKTDDRGDYRISGLPPARYLVCMPSVQNTLPVDAPFGAAPSAAATTDAGLRALTIGAALQSPSRTDMAITSGDRTARLLVGNYATPPPVTSGRAMAYPITFFPGSATPAGATPIELGRSEERHGADITVQPVPVVRVSGNVDGPPDGTRGLVLRLMSAGLDQLGPGGEAASTITNGDGSFTFLNVPAGAYTIDARRTSSELTFPNGAPSVGQPATPGSATGGTNTGTIAGGPAGSGVLSRTGAGPDAYWARTPVTVGSTDLTNVTVALHRCITVSGRMVFEGTSRVTITPTTFGAVSGGKTPEQIRTEMAARPPSLPLVNLEPANGDPTLGVLRSNFTTADDLPDTFAVSGVKSGEYVLRVPASMTGAYTVKSITIAGDDYTDKAIDTSHGRDIEDILITFTDKLAGLSGIVEDDQGLAPQAAVLLFPVERERWTRYGFTPTRLRSTTAFGAKGYAFPNLPAGAYFVVAVDAAQIDAWQDPAFLAKVAPLLQPVTIGWGDLHSLNLKMTRAR